MVCFAAGILTCLGGLRDQALAGAWSQPKGHYYAKLSGILYTSDEVYNDMGVRQAQGMDNDSFDGTQGFLYVEYGLQDRLTIIGQVNAGVLASMNDLVKSETTGIGDFDIGAKYQLVDGPIVLTPFVTMKIPTGYNEHYDPPMGTGNADLELRLLAARSLYPLPLYIGVESGYRFRKGGVLQPDSVLRRTRGHAPTQAVREGIRRRCGHESGLGGEHWRGGATCRFQKGILQKWGSTARTTSPVPSG